MTNIAKAIDRLREERREAQNQVQKLGEAISVLEKLTRGAGATGNLSGSESTLGQDQTDQESGLNAGAGHSLAKSPRETDAR
jgi:hypothetical protein